MYIQIFNFNIKKILATFLRSCSTLFLLIHPWYIDSSDRPPDSIENPKQKAEKKVGRNRPVRDKQDWNPDLR